MNADHVITQTQTQERASTPRSAQSRVAGLARRYAVPGVITALVAAGALFGPSALANGATGAAATGVRLEVGWGYVALAPVTTVLDALSILTLGQHYAVLATLIGVYAAWRVFRRRRGRGVVRRAGVELGVAAASLVGLAAFYAYGMVGPRPMAALEPETAADLVLDVHSHTDASHDGREGFDAEDNREWHRDAGFDAVYVSDHRTWEGWEAGAVENPARAGDGVVLLSALEVKYAGKYASALGASWRYRAAMEGNDLDPAVLRAVSDSAGVRPTLVLTIPGGLDGVPGSTPDSIGYVAVELTDASPKGLRQSRLDRARLLRLADSLDLALVAATNNHGWGRTAAAWTIMRLPGWRSLTPDQLGAAIERRLHEGRREATRVVERRNPWLGESPAALATTVPALTWQLFGGLGAAERVSWLAWTWLLALVVMPAARRSSRPGGTSQGRTLA